MIKRTLDDLNLIDDFMMNMVATNPVVGEPCFRRILSVLLQCEIGQVHVTAQPIILGDDTDFRGVRLDVEVNETKEREKKVANIYDIEPHTKNDLNFPRHNRFYQAKVDGRHLKAGNNDFSKLPNLYVITITNFDIFKKDYMVYTFRNRCEELSDLEYDDGLCYVYFNTKGEHGGSQSIKNMLNYIQKSESKNVSDEATREIDGYVEHVKTDPALKETIMTLGYYIDREVKEATDKAVKKAVEETAEKTALNTKIQVILELLEELGDIPEDLQNALKQIEDPDELKRLHRIAAKVDSFAQFEEAMKENRIST